MSLERRKPGNTVSATPEDHLRMQGLLRYTRNTELATTVRGDVPNMTTLFAGYTSEYTEQGLTLLFRSFEHTDHARSITASHKRRLWRRRPKVNVALKLADSGSSESNLMMKGMAAPVPSEKFPQAMEIFNEIRVMKGLPALDKTLAPDNDEADRQTLYAVDIVSAQTQGQRLSDRGNHVGEGHPELDIQRLVGFEALPALPQAPVPRTSDRFEIYLRAR